MPFATAEQRLGFHFLLPPGEHPTHVRVRGALGSVFLEQNGKPLVLSEFRGDVFQLMKKVAGPATSVAVFAIDGNPAIWVEGATHFLYLTRYGAARELPIAVHGNVLLWQRGGLTLRLQGRLDRAAAVRVALAMK